MSYPRIKTIFGALLGLTLSCQITVADTKTDVVRNLKTAADEIGGALGERYKRILIPFLEAHGQLGQLSTGPHSYISTLTATPKESRESVVILVGKGDSWVEDLELIYDQYQRKRKVFIFDQEGQGLSSRSSRFSNVTDVTRFEVYTNDLNDFIETVVKPGAVGPLHMLTHSTGSTIGQSYLLDHPGVFKDAVHIAPLFKIRLPKPLNEFIAKIVAAFESWKNGPDSALEKFPVEPPDLQGERRKFRWALNRAFSATGGTIEPASPEWVSALINETELLRKRAGEFKTPFLIIQAGQDHTVDNGAQDEVVRKAPQGVARLIQLPTLQHAFLYQDDEALADVLKTTNNYFAEEIHFSPAARVRLSFAKCLLNQIRNWIRAKRSIAQ